MEVKGNKVYVPEECFNPKIPMLKSYNLFIAFILFKGTAEDKTVGGIFPYSSPLS